MKRVNEASINHLFSRRCSKPGSKDQEALSYILINLVIDFGRLTTSRNIKCNDCIELQPYIGFYYNLIEKKQDYFERMNTFTVIPEKVQ